jgi:hypothetical protein
MGYAESLLAAGERFLRRERQHPFMLIWNARYSIIAIALALIGGVLRLVAGDQGGFTGTLVGLLGWIVLIMFVVGIVWFLWGILVYRNTEYLLTSRRIIQLTGVVNKRATDSSLEKINDAVLTESFFGRMFGFGDLDVLTASESGIEQLRMLRDAKDFKKAMLEAKHELELELTRPTMPPIQAQAAPAPAPAAPPAAPAATAAAPAPVAAPPAMSADDIQASLVKLGQMRDQGLITPEEYEAKKQELLDRL